MDDMMKAQLLDYDRLYKELDNFYQRAAQYAGLSDAAYWILYRLYGEQINLIQSDLCKEWFFSKQTINSAVNKLVSIGFITLEQDNKKGHRKLLVLTEEGRKFSVKYVAPVLTAERVALEQFTPKERETMLSLMKKQIDAMNEQVEDLWK